MFNGKSNGAKKIQDRYAQRRAVLDGELPQRVNPLEHIDVISKDAISQAVDRRLGAGKPAAPPVAPPSLVLEEHESDEDNDFMSINLGASPEQQPSQTCGFVATTPVPPSLPPSLDYKSPRQVLHPQQRGRNTEPAAAASTSVDRSTDSPVRGLRYLRGLVNTLPSMKDNLDDLDTSVELGEPASTVQKPSVATNPAAFSESLDLIESANPTRDAETAVRRNIYTGRMRPQGTSALSDAGYVAGAVATALRRNVKPPALLLARVDEVSADHGNSIPAAPRVGRSGPQNFGEDNGSDSVATFSNSRGPDFFYEQQCRGPILSLPTFLDKDNEDVAQQKSRTPSLI